MSSSPIELRGHAAEGSPRLGGVSRSLFSFPNPVNEVAARTVAAGVLALSLLTIVLSTTLGVGWLWLTAPLAYGFLARVLTGPSLEPPGPAGHAGHRAPPRARETRGRPAQALRPGDGADHVAGGAGAHAAGQDVAALVFVGLIVVAATLESVFAYCLGCRVFAGLMRLGLIPAETCEACADISLRLNAA